MRWRRPLILIALLLFAAVVNVAVAWVLVGAPDSWTPGGPRHGDPASEEHRQSILARLNAPPGVMGPAQVLHGAGLGWTTALVVTSDEGGPMVLGRVAAGWPARSMSFTMSQDGELNYSSSLTPPQRLSSGAWFSGQRGDRIPLTPIPAGFGINTLFYAAILALPLSFFPIRRRLRARRGRCPKCGYDLAGLADAAAPCPECGTE